jgi:hypothetical protein
MGAWGSYPSLKSWRRSSARQDLDPVRQRISLRFWTCLVSVLVALGLPTQMCSALRLFSSSHFRASTICKVIRCLAGFESLGGLLLYLVRTNSTIVGGAAVVSIARAVGGSVHSVYMRHCFFVVRVCKDYFNSIPLLFSIG